jgi:hypothetical protein
MSVAYFIVPERAVPDLDSFVNGKPLAAVGNGAIDRVCRESGVRPLTEFFSEAPEEAAAFFADQGIDPPPGGFPPERRFAAADGLRTVQALLARAGELTAAGPAWVAAGVPDDLRAFEVVLAGLEQAKVGWHLAVDF